MARKHKRSCFERNRYIDKGKYLDIEIYNREGDAIAYSKIDKEDKKLVESFKWRLKRYPNRKKDNNNVSYIISGAKAKILHRIIMNCKKGMVVDHINRDTLDNRKKNLRIVTHQQNTFNNNAKGYCKNKYCSTYRVYINRNYKQIHLGNFKTEEAITARKKAELEYKLRDSKSLEKEKNKKK